MWPVLAPVLLPWFPQSSAALKSVGQNCRPLSRRLSITEEGNCLWNNFSLSQSTRLPQGRGWPLGTQWPQKKQLGNTAKARLSYLRTWKADVGALEGWVLHRTLKKLRTHTAQEDTVGTCSSFLFLSCSSASVSSEDSGCFKEWLEEKILVLHDARVTTQSGWWWW